MSGLNERLRRQAIYNRHKASRETFGFQNERKSDLREMLREAVENTAKEQVKDENE